MSRVTALRQGVRDEGGQVVVGIEMVAMEWRHSAFFFLDELGGQRILL